MVTLSLGAENVSTLKIIADDGRSIKSDLHSPIVESIEVFVDKPVIFTLTAQNECFDTDTWPTEEIFVNVVPIPLNAVYFILLGGD